MQGFVSVMLLNTPSAPLQNKNWVAEERGQEEEAWTESICHSGIRWQMWFSSLSLSFSNQTISPWLSFFQSCVVKQCAVYVVNYNSSTSTWKTMTNECVWVKDGERALETFYVLPAGLYPCPLWLDNWNWLFVVVFCKEKRSCALLYVRSSNRVRDVTACKFKMLFWPAVASALSLSLELKDESVGVIVKYTKSVLQYLLLFQQSTNTKCEKQR